MLTDRPPPRIATMPACVDAAKAALSACSRAANDGDVVSAEVARDEAAEAQECAARIFAELIPSLRGTPEGTEIRAAMRNVGDLWGATEEAFILARTQRKRIARAR